MTLDAIGLFLHLGGLIIGLGAVTVIDVLGFCARKSQYWTLATIRSHKITKPLIWLGIITTIIGGLIFYRNLTFQGTPFILSIIAVILIINGLFLSFKVSPHLLELEKSKKDSQILRKDWQRKIICSMIISDIGWWSGFAIIVLHLVQN